MIKLDKIINERCLVGKRLHNIFLKMVFLKSVAWAYHWNMEYTDIRVEGMNTSYAK